MAATTAEETPAADGAEDAEGEAQTGKKKLAGKKIVLFFVLPALLLIGGGVGAASMLGLFGGGEEAAEAARAEPKVEKPAPNFVDMPDMLVNLNNSGDKRQRFLKLSLSLEIENAEDVQKIKAMQPRIVDSFQTFLRDLRIEDLQGSEGVHRVREELLRRVSAVAEPIKVGGVLFREMLVQ